MKIMKKETIKHILDSYLDIIFKQETKIKQQQETINKLSDMSNKHRRSVEILERRLKKKETENTSIQKNEMVGSLLKKLPAFILPTDKNIFYYLSIRNSKEGFEIGYVNNQGEFLFTPQYDDDFLSCLEKSVEAAIHYA